MKKHRTMVCTVILAAALLVSIVCVLCLEGYQMIHTESMQV